MKDKVRIIAGYLATFSTAPWGVLKLVNGKVELDRQKAFNMARRSLNAGANTFRVLRHGVWDNIIAYDYIDEGFWQTFREWLLILHDPYQYLHPRVPNVYGADVWVEIFDGCGSSKLEKELLDKEWMYAEPENSKTLIRQMFSNLGDLDFVKFGCGNEMNQGTKDNHISVNFHKEVIYPEFKKAGRIPFSFGPAYSATDDYLEAVKKYASDYFNTEISKTTFREVHGVRDMTSANLRQTYLDWCRGPIRVVWSCDGVKPRPTYNEWISAVDFILNNVTDLEIANPIDTKLKYGFEVLEELDSNGYPQTVLTDATSYCYHKKFGVWPDNLGKYLYDWVNPISIPPIPPTPPVPPTPPEPEHSWWWKAWHWLFGEHSLWHRIFR